MMEPIDTAGWLEQEADRMEAVACEVYRIRDRLRAKRDALRKAGLEAEAESVNTRNFALLCKQVGWNPAEHGSFPIAWADRQTAGARALRAEARLLRQIDNLL